MEYKKQSAEVVSLPKESLETIRKINENQPQLQQQQQYQQHQEQQIKDKESENMKKEINYNKFKTIVALNKNNNNNNNKTKKEIDVAETTPITTRATTKTKVQANTDVPLQTTPFLTNEVSKSKTKTTTTTGKRVYFDLPQQLNEKAEQHELKEYNRRALTTLQQQKLHQPNRAASSANKNIIFNGTFPIDLPLHSRFDQMEYDAEANASVAELKYAQTMHDYELAEDVDDDDDDDDDDEDEEDDLEDIEEEDEEDADFENIDESAPKGILKNLGILRSTQHHHHHQQQQQQQPHSVWSMQELISNPNIPFNYKKMCNEVEYSLDDFEKYLDSKSNSRNYKKTQTVRTFDIDQPEYLDNKKHL